MKAYGIILMFLIGLFITSCKDLDEMNIDPNGIAPSIANPSHLLPTVISRSGIAVTNLGFGDISGVMQHTQKDGWSGGHNDFGWQSSSHNGVWQSLYQNLSDSKEMLHKAEETNNDFFRGTALVMMAYNFGYIADLWGDAPFSEALRNDEGIMNPKYDSQFDIYKGILDYLDQANTLLSKDQGAYNTINNGQDILYAGDASKWRKFANSLSIRYSLRLSEKDPSFAQENIRKILGDPATYPLILEVADEAAFAYTGNNPSSSWPTNIVGNTDLSSDYHRRKMCATLVEEMRQYNDPRLGVWANRVELPLHLDESKSDTYDNVEDVVFTINGETTTVRCRVIGKGIVDDYIEKYDEPVNYNLDFIGMPPNWTDISLFAYNLSPSTYQGRPNPHCSMLNDIYKLASHELLKSRMLSASEVHFDLAEIALKGWGGNAESHYNDAIRTSFEAWGVAADYAAYIVQPGAAFANTLEQIITQKWVASWSAACESWFDWRRTGYPVFETVGMRAKRDVMPVRLYYPTNEETTNAEKLREALPNFEDTRYSLEEPDNEAFPVLKKNSAWSKMWLLQGTGKPW
ncbi:SusD/RagB family nutrient-binding outer membrane lipoprotein [Parapedobacter koreensis]|uniref:Starch-binding associating with outer membrane n=1 Tax=Parapedobacter koreensis TaxID=332977 RepID=A0A1H7FM02_9SPHI|nr:SusD/RagB family nutrient-binding outer membrane lipoprotein [Parapedobacter koreensis]SEK26998.1 Starch-binding associating with outer membrane [Parapedobacter koreensis]